MNQEISIENRKGEEKAFPGGNMKARADRQTYPVPSLFIRQEILIKIETRASSIYSVHSPLVRIFDFTI